jgi:Trypsin
MKRSLFSRLLSAAMVVTLVLPLAAWPGKKQQTIQPPAPLQQKASHLIHLSDRICTATAVGPHALLTAEHCILDEEGQVVKDHRINLDLSTHVYQMLAVTGDDRDHVILLIDGPAFVNFVNLTTNVRATVPGEAVYMYGNGGGEYPGRRLDGVNVPFDENSDVDQAQHIRRYTIRVIPGDSGSAVYGLDGKIVALVTYKTHDGMAGDCFELDFSVGVYQKAMTFNGDTATLQ